MTAEYKRRGMSTIVFKEPPAIYSYVSVVGKKESEGPLKEYFDLVCEDAMMGKNTWEEAESALQKQAAQLVLEKSGLKNKDIDYIFAGDLLGQTIGTTFGLLELERPLFGLYGACSTMGEALSLAAMSIDGGYAKRVIAMTSSHFASAEKQFRFPLNYGNQRALSATWTVTGSGAMILAKADGSFRPKGCISAVTTGKIVDYGIDDTQNMGACMAPAAAFVIATHLKDLGRKPKDYDRIITGDLGSVGSEILHRLVKDQGYDLTNHMDCGVEIFDGKVQDTHAGGSGCACSAVSLCGFIMEKIQKKEWQRVLFIPTGAMLSKISFNEGQTIPGIAHGVVIESYN